MLDSRMALRNVFVYPPGSSGLACYAETGMDQTSYSIVNILDLEVALQPVLISQYVDNPAVLLPLALDLLVRPAGGLWSVRGSERTRKPG